MSADDAMVLEGNGVRVTLASGEDNGRRCGGCTLCCKLLPVVELKKKANTPCQFQRSGKGCTVHGTRKQPSSCAIWSCRWLMNEDADDLARPDRSHYVIDPAPDVVVLENNETKERTRVMVVQIWVHPSHPNAHRDPKLRAWIERRGASHGEAALIRFDSKRALHLFPPSMNVEGVWHEREGGRLLPENTPADDGSDERQGITGEMDAFLRGCRCDYCTHLDIAGGIHRKRHPSITCPKCRRTSYHPQDIANKYCGWCSTFWGRP